MIRSLRIILAVLCVAGGVSRAAQADLLSPAADEVRDTWRLANGLTVITQNIPGASAVSISVGYHGGSDADAKGHEGLALFTATAAFLAPAGETPARSRSEMASLRPFGFEVKVTRTQTMFTEVATVAQFPGTLLQTAERMRGARVTATSLHQALEDVREEQRLAYRDSPASALYYDVAALAAGADSSALLGLGEARGLDRLGVAEVQQGIARKFVPANGVLSIAGNLTGINLHALVEKQFGAIPAGVAPAAGAPGGFGPGSAALRWPGLEAPVGCIGVLGPTLADTLHPMFFLSLLTMAPRLNTTWGPPQPPLTSRFQYSILDDPQLMRFYPRLEAGDRTPAALDEVLATTVGPNVEMIAGQETLDALRGGIRWMLGGPIPEDLQPRFRRIPGLLLVLSSASASRELWGGEAVWAPYRARFDRCPLDAIGLAQRLKNPANQVRMMLQP